MRALLVGWRVLTCLLTDGILSPNIEHTGRSILAVRVKQALPACLPAGLPACRPTCLPACLPVCKDDCVTLSRFHEIVFPVCTQVPIPDVHY